MIIQSASPEPSSTPTLEPLTVESIKLIGQPGSIEDSGVAEDDPLEAINLRADRLTSLEIIVELSRPAAEPLVVEVYAYNYGDPKARAPVVEIDLTEDAATYRAVINDRRVVGVPGTSVWWVDINDQQYTHDAGKYIRLIFEVTPQEQGGSSGIDPSGGEATEPEPGWTPDT